MAGNYLRFNFRSWKDARQNLPFMALRFIALLFLGLTLAACSPFGDWEDIEAITYEAEYAIPLVDSRMDIRSLLERFEAQTTITVDNEGLLHLRYRGDVLEQTSDDVFASINETLNAIPIIPITRQRQALPISTPDGLQLDRVDLNGGMLRYVISNDRAIPLQVVITLPTVVKDGQPLTIRQQLPAYSGQGQVPIATNAFLPLSLQGYQLSTEGDSLYIEYVATGPNGQRYAPSPNTALNIQELDFTYAEGYFGNLDYAATRDTIRIDFFDNWVRGDVSFLDPVVTFNIENSFGIPTRAVVNNFDVLTVKGERLPLRSTLVQEGIDFPFPGLNEVGQTKARAYTFTRANSNIDQILSAGPVAIDYNVDALTNPDGNSDIRGFLTDSSYYRVSVDVDLPLYGSAVNFASRDTFAIDFSGYDNVTGGEFKLVVDNGVPLAVDVQGYFLSPDGRILDELLDDRQRLVAAAPVGPAGLPTESRRAITFSTVEGERFDRIRGANRLVIEAAFSTTADGTVPVQLRDNQELRVRLGVVLSVAE